MTPGPTGCLKMLCKVCLKSWRKEKKFQALISNLQASDSAQTLTGVQDVSPCYFIILSISIGTLLLVL